MSIEIISTWIAVAGLALSYISDKSNKDKELGRLVQKVEHLEKSVEKVDDLNYQLNQANLHLAKLEAKIDTLLTIIENKK